MNVPGLTIQVPRIEVELQFSVKRDIRALVGPIAAAAEKSGLPFLLKLVVLTDCFQDEVNKLLQDRAGPGGYIAVRQNAQAIARTLWFRSAEGDLGHAIIIDANQIGPWSLNNPRCLTTVLHELFHIPCEGRRLERLGEEEYTAGNDTPERMLDRQANLLLDEFDVDRQVDGFLQSTKTDADGQPWSLLRLNEALGEDWIQGLLAGLDEMPQVIDGRVEQYLLGQIETQDIAELIPYVNDLLTLLTHTASLYLGTDSWDAIMKRIEEKEAFDRFLSGHIETILDQLEASKLPLQESVEIVANALERVFRNCGLHFEAGTEGLYIAVASPSH